MRSIADLHDHCGCVAADLVDILVEYPNTLYRLVAHVSLVSSDMLAFGDT